MVLQKTHTSISHWVPLPPAHRPPCSRWENHRASRRGKPHASKKKKKQSRVWQQYLVLMSEDVEMSKKTANIFRHQKDCHEDGGACSWAKYPHQGQGRDIHRGSQTPKIRLGRCNGCPCKVLFQVWVVFSDAGETSGTDTDTRSSRFPKRCRFGAGLSVITKNLNTRRAVNKICHGSSVYVCLFMTSVCAYLRVGGEQGGVRIIDFDVCVS